jgi:hypothetical protein
LQEGSDVQNKRTHILAELGSVGAIQVSGEAIVFQEAAKAL